MTTTIFFVGLRISGYYQIITRFRGLGFNRFRELNSSAREPSCFVLLKRSDIRVANQKGGIRIGMHTPFKSGESHPEA